MPSIVVPHVTEIGPGYLYRATIGTPIPGQQKTVTLKALTSNVATLTIGAHGILVGDSITVALSAADPIFDGGWTVSAVTGTTLSYAVTHADVSSVAAGGTVTGPASRGGGTVAGGVFVDAWPAAWLPIGVTRDGSQISYELATDDINVAEYLDPLETDETGRTITAAFDTAHITDRNYLLAMNGGTTTTVSGTGATLLTKVSPPVVGGSVPTMLGHESSDGTTRTILGLCRQTGSVQWSNQKAPNFKSLPLTFKANQPATGNPFDIYLAGTTRVAAA